MRPGDSLHAIAYRHRLTVNTLKEINNLRSSNLRIGQVLEIPAEAGDGNSQITRLAAELKPVTPPASRQYRASAALAQKIPTRTSAALARSIMP